MRRAFEARPYLSVDTRANMRQQLTRVVDALLPDGLSPAPEGYSESNKTRLREMRQRVQPTSADHAFLALCQSPAIDPALVAALRASTVHKWSALAKNFRLCVSGTLATRTEFEAKFRAVWPEPLCVAAAPIASAALPASKKVAAEPATETASTNTAARGDTKGAQQLTPVRYGAEAVLSFITYSSLPVQPACYESLQGSELSALGYL